MLQQLLLLLAVILGVATVCTLGTNWWRQGGLALLAVG